MPYTIKDDGLNVLQLLDVDVVDELESEIPVLMISTGHSAYVNTPALQTIYDKLQPEFLKSSELLLMPIMDCKKLSWFFHL